MPTFGKSQVEQSPESAKIQKVATSNMEKSSTLNGENSPVSKKRSVSVQTTNTNLNKINEKKQMSPSKPAGLACKDYFATDPLKPYKDQFHKICESFYKNTHTRKNLLEWDEQLEYTQRELVKYIQRESIKDKDFISKNVRMLANEIAELTDEIHEIYNNPKLCNFSELYNNPDELKNYLIKKEQVSSSAPAGTICEDYFRADPLQAYKDQFHSIRESFYNDIHNRKSLLELDKQLEYIQRELLKNKESNLKDARMLADEAAKLTDEIYKKYNNPKLCNFSDLYNNPEKLKKHLIEKGAALDRRIRAGERATISGDREVANMEVGALVHYLMTKTKDDPFINKKEDKITEFTEGTFLIHDPKHKIRSFLNSHQNAYDRVSSHYVGRSDTWHKGIDVCNNILPADKRTIVYAGVKNSDEDVNQEYFYLKPENYGTDFWNNPIDFMYHGIEFIEAQINKILYPGCDDKSDMRKERVPAKVIKNFTTLLNLWDTCEYRFDLKQEYKNSKEVLRQAKKYGISYIERYLKYFKEEVENKKIGGSSIEDAKKLIRNIRKYYKRAQNNHIRTGREVITHSY